MSRFNVTYTSEDLDKIGSRLYYTAISLIFVTVFTVYIVIRFSNKTMGNYKYYILLTVAGPTVMDFHVSVFFGAFPTVPLPGICAAGVIGRYLGAFWGSEVQYLLDHFFLSFAGNSLVIAVAYRYAVMLEKQRFFHTISGILCCFLYIIAIPIIPAILRIYIILDETHKIAYIEKVAPNLLEFFKTEPCSVVEFNHMAMIYFSSCILTTFYVYAVGLYFVLKTVGLMQKKRQSLSTATYRLYRQLIWAIVAQSVVPFMLLVIPIVSIMLAIMVDASNPKIFADLFIQFMVFHAMANNITILVVIKVYRTAAINTILKFLPFLKCKKTNISPANDFSSVNPFTDK